MCAVIGPMRRTPRGLRGGLPDRLPPTPADGRTLHRWRPASRCPPRSGPPRTCEGRMLDGQDPDQCPQPGSGSVRDQPQPDSRPLLEHPHEAGPRAGGHPVWPRAMPRVHPQRHRRPEIPGRLPACRAHRRYPPRDVLGRSGLGHRKPCAPMPFRRPRRSPATRAVSRSRRELAGFPTRFQQRVGDRRGHRQLVQ